MAIIEEEEKKIQLKETFTLLRNGITEAKTENKAVSEAIMKMRNYSLKLQNLIDREVKS